MKAEERSVLLKELVKIAKENECYSFAMIIAISDTSHSTFYKNGFHKEKKILELVEANKVKHQEDQLDQIVRSITEFRIYNGSEISSFNGMRYDTFKEKFLPHPRVKSAIAEAKRSVKAEIRQNLLESKTPAAQIGLYKLLGTKEEVDRLNGSTQSIDITSGGKPIIQPIVIAMNEEEEE